jgi:Cu(I)/Ag(I) efflux system protein CusF
MKTSSLLVAALLACSANAMAQTKPAAPAAQQDATATKPAAMTEGEIRKIDKGAGTITLRHGPIVNLGMPGMTMVFKATDPKFLNAFKTGDKVRFTADKVGEQYIVTRLEAAK